MFKCNGLQNICDINNIEILVGIEDYVENCYMYYWDEYVNVCIIYDCIVGQLIKFIFYFLEMYFLQLMIILYII